MFWKNSLIMGISREINVFQTNIIDIYFYKAMVLWYIKK